MDGTQTLDRAPLAAVPDEDDPGQPEPEQEPEFDPEALEAARAESAGDPPEAEPEPKPIPPMQIPIPGTAAEITDVAGGSQPTSTEVRLLGGSLPLEGQFEGEEVVQLLVTAKIGAVEIIYTTDDWGETKSVKRRHKARMMSVQRVGTVS